MSPAIANRLGAKHHVLNVVPVTAVSYSYLPKIIKTENKLIMLSIKLRVKDSLKRLASCFTTAIFLKNPFACSNKQDSSAPSRGRFFKFGPLLKFAPMLTKLVLSISIISLKIRLMPFIILPDFDKLVKT